jgi:hypothetical protein
MSAWIFLCVACPCAHFNLSVNAQPASTSQIYQAKFCFTNKAKLKRAIKKKKKMDVGTVNHSALKMCFDALM